MQGKQEISLFIVTIWAMMLPPILFGTPDKAGAEGGSSYGYVEPGIEFSTGDYGTDDDTDVFSIPITVGYSPVPELDFYVTFVPLMYMKTTNLVAVAGRPVHPEGHMKNNPGGGTTTTTDDNRDSETGIGDTTVGFSYFFFQETETLPQLDFSASVKIPTADEDKYLGTGEFDYFVELGASKSFGVWGVQASVEYNFIGDPGDDYDLNDYAGMSLALVHRTTDRIKNSLFLYAAEAISDDSDDQLEMGFRTRFVLDDSNELSAFVARGLQDGSPDWDMGIYWTYYF